jgi:hypothetical protein
VKSDKLASIRDVWDMFIPLLRRFYIPGLKLAVDEQLVGYRGRIPGRIYMSSKPKNMALRSSGYVRVVQAMP